MKLAICVGHNEKYKGAVGSLGISEFDYNSILAEDIIAHNYVKSVELRVFKREPIKSYKKQMKKLNKELKEWGADIAIELHFNAANDASANGHEVLYCKDNPKSKKVAKVFSTLFNLLLDNKNRGLKEVTKYDRGGRFVCKSIPSIIIEPYFASHQHKFRFNSEGYSEILGAILVAIYKLSRSTI